MLGLIACKGPGKSCGEAWVVWWFLACFFDAEVVCTSITGDNLKANLWKELGLWYRLSPMLQKGFDFGAEKITQRERPETWWCFARSFPQDADKSQQANTLAGLHSKNVMYVGDEAGDYPDGVVAAAEGIFASKAEVAILVLGGNPTRNSGPMWRASRNPGGRWWVKRITGDPDDPGRAKRINVEWARAMILEHGREHPWVKINVLGEFPDVASDKLLGPDDVEKANRRAYHAREYEREPLIAGLDTARQGDDQTALCLRRGPICMPLRTWRVPDSMRMADILAGIFAEEKPRVIFIDTGGPSGFAILDRLRQLGYPAEGIDFGTDPVGDDPLAPLFANRRAEMHYKAAKWVKKMGSLPVDTELAQELIEPAFWMRVLGKQTKFLLEPKDAIKQRLSRSPDRADAFALTFAAPVAPPVPQGLAAPAMTVETDFDPWAVMAAGVS